MSRKYLFTVISGLICIALYYFNITGPKYSDKNFEEEGKKYPSEREFIMRTFPFYNADPEAYRLAIAQTIKMRADTKSSLLQKKMGQPQWEFAGPVNIGGRVVDIEFDPVNPKNVYAAAATGGILKSTDNGITWYPIFDNQAVLTIGDLAVNPKNPDIIYAGTGEANGGHNNFPGGGLYKSTDAGSTWNFIGLENSTSIGRIVIDPVNPEILYVAAVGSYFSPNPERGVYKSTDGGKNWTKSLFISDSTGAIDIVIDPRNPDILIASTWERVRRPNSAHLNGPTSAIYKTINKGETWTRLTSGLPASATKPGRIGLAMSASNPSVIYALYNDGSSYSGLYKTTNSGDTWVNADPANNISGGTSDFSWYFGQVRVHPTNPDIVYVMDVSFMRSINGGADWPVIYGYGGPAQLHVDHHALAFDPSNPNHIINGNDGGINYSNDAGVTWSQPALLPITQFYEIGLDFNKPERLYGGTQDNNTIRTLNSSTDNWSSIYGGDGFYVVVDPTNSDIIYSESQYGYLGKSTDGGYNFGDAMNGINSSEPTNWSTPVVIDPNNNNTLYYGTNKIYRTTNAAQSWTAISPVLSSSPAGSRLGTVTTIAVAPSNSAYVYAGTDDGNLWVTNDNGADWKKINAGLPYRWVTRVIPDPKDEHIIYVTFSGLKWKDPQPHVFRSTNTGENWTDISSNLPDAPVNAFAVDLHNTNTLYLGSDVGAFVSFNNGAAWQTLGTGLPVVPVYDMKIHPQENYLAVGTYGRSMYKMDLSTVVDALSPNSSSTPKVFALNQNYPNPFNPSTTITYKLGEKSYIKLKVYDLRGREIKILKEGYENAGIHQVNFEAGTLTSGIYYYRLETDRFTETRKCILLK